MLTFCIRSDIVGLDKKGENISMTKEQKIKIFKPELDYIQIERIRMAGELLIGEIPDYFFEVAASSTGKYHPSFSLGEGGLLRHTKAAVKIAQELLSLEMFCKYAQETKDLMVLALILATAWITFLTCPNKWDFPPTTVMDTQVMRNYKEEERKFWVFLVTWTLYQARQKNGNIHHTAEKFTTANCSVVEQWTTKAL